MTDHKPMTESLSLSPEAGAECERSEAMIVVSEIRCSDCLNEFHGGPRYAVIKEDRSRSYSKEERQLSGHLYEVLVCGDCVGWYEDAAEIEGAPR